MKHAKYILILASLATAAACTGDFEQYNDNPNKQSQGSIAPISMLEPLLYASSNEFDRYMLEIANEISQVTVAKSNPRREHAYNLADGNFQAIWNLCYKWANNAQEMYNLAVAQNEQNLQAIGLTIKVYHMQILTDMFGSVPYKEALKVNDGITKPHVDSQKEVYEAMLADLEKANSLYNLDLTLNDPTKDGIYGGNMNKWKKFTNTLHLRLLMRVSGRNDDFSPTVGERIAAIVNDPETYPVFESNEDSASVKFSGTATYYRNYFNLSEFANDIKLSSDRHIASQFLGMIYDKASGFEDPRMRIWIKPRYVKESGEKSAEVREMIGAISGCTTTHNESAVKDFEPYLHYETLVGDTRPNHLLDYDELLFIKAEAALNGWIGGTAREYYEAAVQASCEKWAELGEYASYPSVTEAGKLKFSPVTITQKNISALLSSEQAKWDGTQQRIAEQKWLALFWNAGFQQFHEMRRTGYPECKIGLGAIDLNRTDGKFIARYPYPLIAIANNRANYTAAYAAQGATIQDNTMVFPVWWSGQAVAKDAGHPWPHSFRTLEIAEEKD